MNYFIHCVIVLSVMQVVFGNGSNVAIIQPHMESCPSLGSCFTLASCLQNTSACLLDNSVVTRVTALTETNTSAAMLCVALARRSDVQFARVQGNDKIYYFLAQ